MTKQEIEDVRTTANNAVHLLSNDLHGIIADRNQLLKCARALAGMAKGYEESSPGMVIATGAPDEQGIKSIITLGDCRRARDMLRRMGEE